MKYQNYPQLHLNNPSSLSLDQTSRFLRNPIPVSPPISRSPPSHPEEEEKLVPHSEFGVAEKPQQMEESEGSNTVDSTIVDDQLSERFIWKIENFSRLIGKKLFSDFFFVEGYKWRVFIYPKGNGVDHLSVYLEVADPVTSYGWSRCAQYMITVVDQIHHKLSMRKETHHQFNARERDWGFTRFMPLSELHDPSRGYLLNDTFILEADVTVLEPEDKEMLIPHSKLVAAEGPQPMGVAPSARFIWTIENFSSLTGKKLYSDVFFVGGYKWRVFIYPKGNRVDNLSVYLYVADSITLPYGWSRYTQYMVTVVDQIHRELSMRKDTHHQFDARERDWGFTRFMPLSELHDPGRGYLLNDTFILEIDVVV